MGRPRGGARVLGPYAEPGGYRVRWIDGAGTRRADFFKDKSEAEKHAAGLRAGLAKVAQQAERSLGALLLAWSKTWEVSPTTRETYSTMSAWLWPQERERLASSITPVDVREELDRLRAEGYAVASIQCVARRVKCFFAWLVERGLLKTNPAAAVKVKGRANRGKVQLTVDEARRLWRVALSASWEGSLEALGVALLIRHGLRAREVLRQVRDLDEGGAVLVVSKSKTAAGVRRVRLDPALVALLKFVSLGRGPEEALLPGLSYQRLARGLPKLLGAASCPRVTLHGLRGTFATLAITEDAPSAAVGRALGHASDRVTRAHYYRPGAAEEAQDRARGAVFDSVRNRSEDRQLAETTGEI